MKALSEKYTLLFLSSLFFEKFSFRNLKETYLVKVFSEIAPVVSLSPAHPVPPVKKCLCHDKCIFLQKELVFFKDT